VVSHLVYDEGWNYYIGKSQCRGDTINVSIDVTYNVDGDTLRFEWRAKDSAGSEYSYSGTSRAEGISDDYVVRIDTQPPQYIDDLVCYDTTSTTIELNWTTLATDDHFKQYEIYYSTIDSVTQNDSCWCGEDDSTLYDVNTTQTIITVIDNIVSCQEMANKKSSTIGDLCANGKIID